ncbi:uncharacterized protein LOC144231660 isoform X2 [Crocuta crocuta]
MRVPGWAGSREPRGGHQGSENGSFSPGAGGCLSPSRPLSATPGPEPRPAPRTAPGAWQSGFHHHGSRSCARKTTHSPTTGPPPTSASAPGTSIEHSLGAPVLPSPVASGSPAPGPVARSVSRRVRGEGRAGAQGCSVVSSLAATADRSHGTLEAPSSGFSCLARSLPGLTDTRPAEVPVLRPWA